MEIKKIAKDLPKIKELMELGHTEDFILKLFGIPKTSWNKWIATNADFKIAVAHWKQYAVDHVERKLFERAVGYTYPSEKLFCYEGVVTRAKTEEHVPPDVNAAKFFLTNQAPTVWKDKVEHGHDVSGSLADMILKARGRVVPPELDKSLETKTQGNIDEEDFLK